MPLIRQTATRRSPPTRSTTRRPASRIEQIRVGILQMFSGRSTVGNASSPPQSPKTPRLELALNNISSTRLVLPHLSRTTTTPSPQSPHSLPQYTPTIEALASSRPTTGNSLREQSRQLNTSALPSHYRHNSTHRFVDPAEQHLAALVGEGRRRKHKTHEIERRCGPKVKNDKIRAKIWSCFVSGLVSPLL
jgi:hypothetical protein